MIFIACYLFVANMVVILFFRFLIKIRVFFLYFSSKIAPFVAKNKVRLILG